MGQSIAESSDSDRSDPAVNFESLPDDHPVFLLTEAKSRYKDNVKPPFAIGIRRPSEMIKSVVIPTRNPNALRPKEEKATKVNIVAKVCPLRGHCSRSMHFPEAGLVFESHRAHFQSHMALERV